ncbi:MULTISPECIES: hypothetical protein [unclassified Acinetobacter]|uniref:AbiTii domain-containing protein n=1 Tax=unclassified Acinetobacter TaxID=196816 RepID=UPI0015D36617|nr:MULTISPECIES: hypothetical protein [unclassified Acinetobacter]UUS61413.1 hypothetical protein MST17_03505 [Acinetobacter sp. YH16056_T]
MSLLREIQNDAVNSNIKVSDLLRRCKVLAYRLGNEDFKTWVDSELNGYESLDGIPSYRIYNDVNSKGHFSGAFGSGLRNADIPSNCFPKEFRKNLTTVSLTAPIAEFESLVINAKKGKLLQQPWDANFVAMFSNKIYKNMVCVQAWKVIPSTKLEGIIDIVKTKILNFVLEIEVINPEAGEAKLNTNPIPQDKVSQIFNINISGNVGNLASGNSNSGIQQSTNNEIPKEFLEIITKIQEENSDENSVLQELENKVEELGRNVGTVKYSEKYKELISFMSDHATVVSGLILPVLPYLSSLLNI